MSVNHCTGVSRSGGLKVVNLVNVTDLEQLVALVYVIWKMDNVSANLQLVGREIENVVNVRMVSSSYLKIT